MLGRLKGPWTKVDQSRYRRGGQGGCCLSWQHAEGARGRKRGTGTECLCTVTSEAAVSEIAIPVEPWTLVKAESLLPLGEQVSGENLKFRDG